MDLGVIKTSIDSITRLVFAPLIKGVRGIKPTKTGAGVSLLIYLVARDDQSRSRIPGYLPVPNGTFGREPGNSNLKNKMIN
jgi:hypothetical protein